MKIFVLPDLGEGLPDAEIHEWFVKEGEAVTLDQPIVAMETAKAIVDVPAPFAGKIAKCYGDAGDVIDTGAPLIAFESDEFDIASQEPSLSSTDTADKGTVVGNISSESRLIEGSGFAVTNTAASAVFSLCRATPRVRALAQRLGCLLYTSPSPRDS